MSELQVHNCMLSKHIVKSKHIVNLTLVQCERHIGKRTVTARINPNNQKTPDFTFSRNFCFLVPISRGRQMPVLHLPADAHGSRQTHKQVLHVSHLSCH